MKANFELSSDVQRLIDFLADRSRVTYSEMSNYTKRAIAGRDRYVLESARRVLEKRGIIFAIERGVGLVRATNSQVATLSTTHPITKIRRIAKRADRRQVHVNVQSLTADERLAFSVGRVVLNAIGQNTLQSFRSRISKEIEKRDGELINTNQIIALRRLKGDK